MFGVASFDADFEYDESAQTLSLPYNEYGTKDADNKSIQWQAGGDTGLDILSTAVYDLNGNTAWVPAIGETFVVNISGVPDMTGTDSGPASSVPGNDLQFRSPVFVGYA